MLRRDVKYMLDRDWEPTVPHADVIRKQSGQFYGRVSGSVRLAQGCVVTEISHASAKKRKCLKRISLTK